MVSFNELMQSYVDLSYEALVQTAQLALGKLLPVCKKVDPEHEGVFMVISLVLSAVAADGVLSEKEQHFLGDVLGMDEAAINTAVHMYSSDMVDLVDQFADGLDEDTKVNSMMLIIAVAACDETISREETALIRKIIA